MQTPRDLARRYIRLPTVLAVRAYVRHAPILAGKRLLWRIASPIVRDGWIDHPCVARTRFGAEMAVNPADFIDRFIYYAGIWEPNVSAYLSRTLRAGDVFVDVGANIGHHTLLGASLVGPGSVVAIEASPRIFQDLRANLERNGLRDVRCLNEAASDRPGRLTLHSGAGGNRGAASILETGGEEACEVPARPLDEMLTADEFARARLVKIDVEGAEGIVLAGMQRLLRSGRPELEVLVEIDPARLARIGSSAARVFAEFAALGYSAYRLHHEDELSRSFQPAPAAPPRRVRAPPGERFDAVFSRRDAERL
jgi:FkbM family methyltransferase